jgi:hypothetical protein
MTHTASARIRSTGTFWSTRREATLNWLALGLLLAAWNGADRDVAGPGPSGLNASVKARPRPAALRGYSFVSVRAVSRAADRGS